MAAAVPAHTIEEALGLCGVPDAPLFGGLTPRERMADQMFFNSYDTVLSVTIDEVNDAMTAFTKLAVTQGRISLQPGVKKRVTAFVQWARSEIRCGRDPGALAYPVGNLISQMHDLRICENFENQSDTIIKQASPKPFTSNVQWNDWMPTLVNYLKLIPGRSGIQLSYVIRSRDAPDSTFVGPILDVYVAQAPLLGDTFEHDSQRVHTLILTFITEYPEMEAIVRTATQKDGRVAYQAMAARFEGT